MKIGACPRIEGETVVKLCQGVLALGFPRVRDLGGDFMPQFHMARLSLGNFYPGWSAFTSTARPYLSHIERYAGKYSTSARSVLIFVS